MIKGPGHWLAHTCRASIWHYAGALLAGAAGYAVANRFQLVHTVAYRAAAGDLYSAAIAAFFLGFQALCLLAVLILLERRLAWFVLALAGMSIMVNIAFTQLVPQLLDAGIATWMIGETRMAGAAWHAFGATILWAAVQACLAILLLAAARALVRRSARVRAKPRYQLAALLFLLVPSALYRLVDIWPEGAERNLYGLAFDVASAPAPPLRASPTISLTRAADTPQHIVWLIDESVAAGPFGKVVAPQLAKVPHLDFGAIASLGHCSTPAHVALRAGVDVREASPSMDLRRTPSIWAYARRAGYKTVMIEGQTSGPPQNMMLPPERMLIDEYRSILSGMNTDREIAGVINDRIRKPGRSFIYAVLRGVHFQYSDHYPEGVRFRDAPPAAQYAAALSFSKRDFFERLLGGVERETVAIIYTSDHGQNLAPGALPHCSRSPVADEFRVPLLLFLPPSLASRYEDHAPGSRSASQIFPATLGWMGYDRREVSARYDHDLDTSTAQFTWFDRAVVPQGRGGQTSVAVSRVFPGLDTAGPAAQRP